MTKLKKSISGNLQFNLFFLLFLLITSLFLLATNDPKAFLLLNGYHSRPLDNFFSWYTFIGNGYFSVILGVIFIYKKRGLLAKQVLAAYLFSGIIVQLIKNFVYAPRPKLFFEPAHYNQFIDGVTLANASAFPSGHATSAFALATILAFHSKSMILKYLYLLAAILAGFSRVYLGQHFPGDVIAGALIGVVTATGIHAFVQSAGFSFRFNGIFKNRNLNRRTHDNFAQLKTKKY